MQRKVKYKIDFSTLDIEMTQGKYLHTVRVEEWYQLKPLFLKCNISKLACESTFQKYVPYIIVNAVCNKHKG